MTLVRNLSRDGKQEPKCLSPTPCPVFGLILRSISEPKVIVLELKQTLINNLANAVFLKKETVKGKGGIIA